MNAPLSRVRTRPGFALVVTISLLLLLTLMAVGLLSLATVEIRSSRRGEAMAEARANARLALTIALGELQTQLGPDQRISSNSGVYDDTPDSSEMDGLDGSSQILGVWDSWQTWLNAKLETADGEQLSIADTYQKGRHERLFRKWLVSHPNPDLLAGHDTPFNGGFGFDYENSIPLVGPGSLGASPPEDHLVRGGLIPASATGAFAWWIGAENQKAAIQTPALARNSKAEIRAGLDSLSHMDVRGLKGLDQLPLNPESTPRYITSSTAAIPLAANGGSAESLSKYFHAVTPFSRSLLVDVRDGGLKRDLSLLFEKDTLPIPYRKTSTLEPGVRPWSTELLAHHQKLRQRTLFSWERMHNYYRMYREQRNPIRNHQLRAAFQPSTQYRNESPFVTMFLNKNKRSAVGTYNDDAYVRMPVMLKHYANIGLQTEKDPTNSRRYRYYINFAPVTVLWNPYNIRLELPDDFLGQTTLFYKNLPMEYMVWINGRPQGGWRYFGFNRNDNTLGGDLQTHFTRDGSPSRSPIIFEPGEMLVFSHADDSAHKWKNAKFELGYQPQNFDSRRLLVPGLDKLRGQPRVSISMRFSNRLGGNAGGAGANRGSFAVRYTTVKGTLGNNQVTESAEVTDGDAHMPAWLGIDWLLPSQANQVVIPDSFRNAAPFQYADSEPYAIASIGIAAKSSAQPTYTSSLSWESDWRSKNWLHASPAFFGTQLLNPTDRNRAQCPYFLHFTELDGGVDISSVTPHFGDNGILGSGVSGAEQVSFAPILEIPTQPIASLAGFAGARLLPGWWDESRFSRESPVPSDLTWMIKRMSYHSGVPGVGIGNSFAHPMLEPKSVYTYHDVSKCDHRDYTEAFSDYWDHLFLANDALWDNYFLSSIATRSEDGSEPGPTERVGGFFRDGRPLDDVRLQPHLGQDTPEDIIDVVLSDEGWQSLASHLMVNGGFNVNSTSLEAWKALFYGLLGRPYVYQELDGSIGTITPSPNQAVLSRFHLPTTREECTDPRTGVVDAGTGLSRWSGVRYIDREQLDQLAVECVRQVKLRGPFLNMSEFINRRLSADELGARGALQAAIDYDDKSPDPSSINYNFKRAGDMIDQTSVAKLGYPFPEAATGSRFTGIPGYVVQSDVLQAFGNTLTVRDDSFRIRAYGESRDGNGRVEARAWCEANVQRYPEFIDPENAPHKSATTRDGIGRVRDNTDFAPVNARFGRRFRIVQFRWLQPNEV